MTRWSLALSLFLSLSSSLFAQLSDAQDWDRFHILIWQYQTTAERDLELYREGGFTGFHIDRGHGQEARVRFARENALPYYVDHLADKGILHLTERTGVDQVLRKRELIERPHSLARPETMVLLKEHIAKNIAVTKEGPVLAYAFDDEISLGSFNSPAEVDSSPESVAGYRTWLSQMYPDIAALNAQWGSDYGSFAEVNPVSFEDVRKAQSQGPFASWNLSPWMDWRAYMDTQFADVLAELTRYTNSLDPDTPAGFVGGQQPSPYGGFDYAKLCRAVQFMEAYDIGSTVEILRSFWPDRDRAYMQTWFSTGNVKADAWFLWYYLVHGNSGVIAWPDMGGGKGSWFQYGEALHPHFRELAPVCREIQGEVSEAILGKDVRFDADPIAVYYSMPSIRASWVTDVIPHGGTWPNRSSSLDNQCQSAGKNREAWFKLLEDCGYQYNVVSSDQVVLGHLVEKGYRVLILNRALCVSDAELDAIESFVRAGGTVIADHWTGLLDAHGRGRASTERIDRLFGFQRRTEPGYFGGDGLNELNGEKYREPYLQRLAYENVRRHQGMVVVGDVAGTIPVKKAHPEGGNTWYLDTSPLEYWDPEWRAGSGGEAWRETLTTILREAGLVPRAQVLVEGNALPMVEMLHWRGPERRVLAIVANPTRQGSVTSLGKIDGLGLEPRQVTIQFREPRTGILDRRTGKRFADGSSIELEWNPWEALVIESN